MRSLVIGAALLSLVASAGGAQTRPARTLDIYYVDVEGGAATLIVTPAGESVLVDTGWPRDDARDARRIQEAARQAGISRINHLVITHFHTDHWGGVANLVKVLPVDKFYDHGRRSELAEDQKNFPRLNAAYLEASQEQTQALHPADEIQLKSANASAPVRLLVVSSDGQALQRAGAANPQCATAELQKDDPTDNARSVGFVLTFGKFRFFDVGDLTWNIEHQLVCPTNVLGRIDVYQVTHHGMNISNDPALLRSVQPRVAIMNNGPRKGGHPDVVKWLRALPSLQALYQVHRNVASKDEEHAPPEFIANLGDEAGCTGNMIKVSVAPGGASYTVTNTRTSQSRKFLAKN